MTVSLFFGASQRLGDREKAEQKKDNEKGHVQGEQIILFFSVTVPIVFASSYRP
jgi:hypothetical protein